MIPKVFDALTSSMSIGQEDNSLVSSYIDSKSPSIVYLASQNFN